MKKTVILFVLLLTSPIIFSQVVDQEIESEKLGEKANKIFNTETDEGKLGFIILLCSFLVGAVIIVIIILSVARFYMRRGK